MTAPPQKAGRIPPAPDPRPPNTLCRRRAWVAVCLLAGGVAAEPAESAGKLHFTLVPDAAGIDLVSTSGSLPSREILEVNGGGIALFDYDRDGDLDVFLANGATLADPEGGPGSRLYANRGDGTFADATESTGINLTRWAMGVAVGDYDGDGWDDIYVTCFGANVLLRNTAAADGSRRFVDVTSSAGVGDPRWSTSASFADLDDDGDLDLFVANYLVFDPRKPPRRSGRFKGVEVMAGPRGLVSQPNTLYENLGNGTFREVTTVSGVAIKTGLDYSLGVRAFDFDGDSRIDLFVGNDSTENHLLRNLGGLRFEDVAAAAGVAANGRGLTQATMGIALADVDGNGALDLFTTNFSDDTNTLQLSLPDGFFDDRTAAFGLGAVSRPYLGWGAGFYDFDLDGDEDLFVANGHVYPELDSPELGASWAQVPLVFERRGPRFERVAEVGAWAARPIHGRATAFGDIDGDGDVDVLVTTLNGPVQVLRNDTPAGRTLVVELEAPPPNRHGYGSLIEVHHAGVTQRRWITGGGSFQSFDEPAAFFGLGEAKAGTRVTLRVRWPDGTTTAYADVEIGQRVAARPDGTLVGLERKGL